MVGRRSHRGREVVGDGGGIAAGALQSGFSLTSGSRSSTWSCTPTRRATDRVRTLRDRTAKEAWPRETGDPRLPRIHALLREDEYRAFLAETHHRLEKRMRAKLAEVKDQLKQRRHQPLPEQGQWLASVARGHLNYYAVP